MGGPTGMMGFSYRTMLMHDLYDVQRIYNEVKDELDKTTDPDERREIKKDLDLIGTFVEDAQRKVDEYDKKHGGV